MSDAESTAIVAELEAALRANGERLSRAIRVELDKPIALEAEQRIQFEIDPFSFRLTFTASEEDLLPDDWLDEATPDQWFVRAGDVLGGFDELVAERMTAWIADAWASAGGPARFSPAFIFFHGYHQNLYDLEQRRWLSGDELEARWSLET
jgi:hypothetical protein